MAQLGKASASAEAQVMIPGPASLISSLCTVGWGAGSRGELEWGWEEGWLLGVWARNISDALRELQIMELSLGCEPDKQLDNLAQEPLSLTLHLLTWENNTSKPPTLDLLDVLV